MTTTDPALPTEKIRTQIAQAVQRGQGNDWLAADYVLELVAPLLSQLRADGEREGRRACIEELRGKASEARRIADERRAADDPDVAMRHMAADVQWAADYLARGSS